jgi:hypothetical protein
MKSKEKETTTTTAQQQHDKRKNKPVSHSHSHEDDNGFAAFLWGNPESWKIGCVFAVIRVVFSADHLGTLPAENARNHNPWNRLWLRSLYFRLLYFCYNRRGLTVLAKEVGIRQQCG